MHAPSYGRATGNATSQRTQPCAGSWPRTSDSPRRTCRSCGFPVLGATGLTGVPRWTQRTPHPTSRSRTAEPRSSSRSPQRGSASMCSGLRRPGPLPPVLLRSTPMNSGSWPRSRRRTGAGHSPGYGLVKRHTSRHWAQGCAGLQGSTSSAHTPIADRRAGRSSISAAPATTTRRWQSGARRRIHRCCTTCRPSRGPHPWTVKEQLHEAARRTDRRQDAGPERAE